MAHTTTPVDHELVSKAVQQFDAGDPALLRELNEWLSSSAARQADAIMAVSQNRLSERESFLANALFHKLIGEPEMLALALANVQRTDA